jgi:hypothetical protein
MKYLSKIIFSIFTLSILMVACKKEGDLPSYADSKVPVLSASKAVIAPAVSDSDNVVATLNWTDPLLSTDSAHKMYLIEIDSTGRGFAKATKLTVYGSLKKALKGSELNNILLNFGFNFNVAYDIDIRVTSSYLNNNDMKVSNIIKVTATPYKVPPKIALPTTNRLFIVGGASTFGWSNNTTIDAGEEFARLDETTWVGVFYLSGGEYLILPEKGSWTHKFAIANKSAAGASDAGSFGFDLGDNFPAPATTGWYKVTMDFQRGKYVVEPFTGPKLPTDLFIVGGGTPGGWNNPVPVPSQQFLRLNSCEFEIASLALNQANGMFLLLPVNGSWASKYGGVGGNNGSNQPLGDKFKEGGSDLKAPDVAGNYKINVNFATEKYKASKL